jgi:hypothetical protein
MFGNFKERKVKVDDIEITIFEDGRIAPVEKAKGLKESTLDKILSHMRFNNEEILGTPKEMKEDLVQNGGKKVGSPILDFTSVYTDLEGVDHLVTDQNEEEINEKIDNDLEKFYKKKSNPFSILKFSSKNDRKEYTNANKFLGKWHNSKSKPNNGISLLADSSKVTDGIWSGYSSIVYGGTVNEGREFVYFLYSRYNWNGVPSVYFDDYVALAWQANGTPSGQSFQHTRYYYGNYYNYTATEVDNGSITGTRWEFDILGTGDKQYGYGKQHIRIPVSNKGNTGAIAAGYAHPYLDGVVKAVLSAASINWDDSWAMKKTWRQNFIIGQ